MEFEYKRREGRPIGFRPPKTKRNRRHNPNPARSRAVTWTPDHDQLVEECLNLWPLQFKKERINVRGASSMIVATGMALLLQYLRFCEREKKAFGEESQLEFFRSTEYIKAMKWFTNLQGDFYHKDKSKVLKTIYGLDSELIEENAIDTHQESNA